ncbi:uncharacterized protein At1g32220, chloroplastic-like [Zingiber officinale]|uniref:NAD(P)-binding domain-containing protein n=1 Tax=Zingiber officinale TaxID=94328 RepID=A0A8J5C8K3_ZINOF|nr:uncharacterized protein At1g32220, chloroplastic-like [Zingiber officinale]XP_042445064.1 uncharacterized protein At1g32220, chloroplastic-like [Zingiber officinale]KAG6472939.1 hypothetical protein ZIOFF_070418 [Zingiber officinale]KAG6474742.1 hypothetical protein ZIOFF_068681 [Zingiber officinale]
MASQSSSNKLHEPLVVKGATQPTKLLLLGGNGFIGTEICKLALDQGLSVSSLSRSGRSSTREPWADKVEWHKGNLLEPESLKGAMTGVSVVISLVGGFGSYEEMIQMNGTANINAIRVAAEKGVERFVFVSAADFRAVEGLIRGYHEGKRLAEAELKSKFPEKCVILRPGYVYGTKQLGSMKLPLWPVFAPFEMVLQHFGPLYRLPLVGPFFTPPISVAAVAKLALRGATDPAFPHGAIEIHDMIRLSKQK